MNNTVKLGLLLPAVLNPVIAVVGVGLGLVWLFRDDEDEATVEAKPIKRLPPPVRTAVKPSPTVELEVREVETNEAVPAPLSETDQKEMIRKTMSELGKRSAAARAKRRAEREYY